MQTDPLTYYAQPGLMTDLSDHDSWLQGLPTTIAGLCEVVQNVMIHIHWADSYDVTLSEERQAEVQIRAAAEMLNRIRANDDSPLTEARPAEQRLVGNCRDFSVLTTALLRHQGIPARARCGFGTYFEPEWYVDHWITEVWQADEGRWLQFDAQLDELQCIALGINFDPGDMPPGQFLSGGQAWQLCRAGEADSNKFGILDMWGLWYARSNLVRDLASLNKIELLPWDYWGTMLLKEEEAGSAETLALMDQVAELTLADNDRFAEVITRFGIDDRLRVPVEITSYVDNKPQTVMIVEAHMGAKCSWQRR